MNFTGKRILSEIKDKNKDYSDIVTKKLHTTPVLEKDKISNVILDAEDEKSTNVK